MTSTFRALAVGLLLSTSSVAIAKEAPIVLPGAPGQPSRTVSEADAIKLANADHAPGDVAFMQGMIVHHQQAVDMAKLAKDRTNNKDVTAAATRIEASQKDEMKFMSDWLTQRGEPVAMPAMDHAHHGDHSMMKGMATPAQMAELAAASGTAFDRLFFQLMIAHHKGALDHFRIANAGAEALGVEQPDEAAVGAAEFVAARRQATQQKIRPRLDVGDGCVACFIVNGLTRSKRRSFRKA